MSETEFLNNMELKNEDLNELKIKPKELMEIYEDYESKKEEFKIHADFIANLLRESPKAHSVRSRVKDSKSLINKVVRKTKEKNEKKTEENNDQKIWIKITKNNYMEMLDDLIGVRILHTFKKDWQALHDIIVQRWKPTEIEANTRKGDDIEIFEQKNIAIINRDTGYRSVHYVIQLQPTNEKIKAEVQVRTIFEEGYGEIDHYIRYPDKQVDPYIEKHLLLLNRLAGSTDEMGAYTEELHENLEKRKAEYAEQQLKLERIKKDLEESQKVSSQQKKITVPDMSEKIDVLSGIINRMAALETDTSFDLPDIDFELPSIKTKTGDFSFDDSDGIKLNVSPKKFNFDDKILLNDDIEEPNPSKDNENNEEDEESNEQDKDEEDKR
jgi:ppGpp synthetase/RelA/SpoT-type nucleotidyltranferase